MRRQPLKLVVILLVQFLDDLLCIRRVEKQTHSFLPLPLKFFEEYGFS
jgi:hypothetical protein